MRKLCILMILLLAASICGAQDYNWQKQHAKVLPTGDLEWAPAPFEFKADGPLRYIDYENGNDNNPGTKASPWKHHPWDKAASGNAAQASGPATYVFKQGVAYRGAMEMKESGQPGKPIRLTRDPSWGEGPAMIYGSERATGWKKLTAAQAPKGMPNPEKVWYTDLPYLTRAVWLVEGDEITRLKLARTPNWELDGSDDVRSQWWSWENPEWWKRDGRYKTTVNGKKMHLAVDKKNLTRDADYYEGALVWSEWTVMMGAPYAAPVEKFYPDRNGIAFQGPWHNDSQGIATNNRYYLEDKPHYLDQAGEYWFEKKGRQGRLYVRLPEDADPNGKVIEAAKRINFIDSAGASNIEISGLTFGFGNIFWNLDYRFFQHPDVDGAVIRVLGEGENIIVRNNVFHDIVKAIRIETANGGTLDHVFVTDNDVTRTDHGGIHVKGEGKGEAGKLVRLQVLRNRLHDIGARPLRPNGHFALKISYPLIAEIAGNYLDFTYAAGIDTHGGKGSGAPGDAPLTRILIYNNKVTNINLGANDWGGIETWQGGPYYVFNNVSGNPVGPMNWTGKTFSHAYYLDGAFKNYHFNNIAWGKANDPNDKRNANVSAFQEIISYQNTFVNNTAYKFLKGSRRQAPQAGRDKFLGNVFTDISETVFRHTDAEGEDPNVHHAGAQADDFAYETDAYANNVFYKISGILGNFQAQGGDYKTPENMSKALETVKAMATNVGIMADKPVLRDTDSHDFRPTPDSPVIDYGIKAFIPWSLYGTVAEWNFTRNNEDPTRVIDEHWYMTEYHVGRDDYYKRPMYPLTAKNISAQDYVSGPLEDWTLGALKLNGRDQYLELTDAYMNQPYEYTRKNENLTASGEQLKNPEIYRTNMIVEAYLRTDSGADGVIIGKASGNAGYRLAIASNGQAEFSVKGEGKSASVSGGKINDGEWHHVLAELDRNAGKVNLYIDGKLAASSSAAIGKASLENDANLYVGSNGSGDHLACEIEFLRIAQGSLADSYTTIDELYTWQFNGPILRDFTGMEPTGKKRDAGAIELR
ncbi:MAG: LamG-like jellyroll fold domain-containing protein [Candidatus Sumerlaeia bacterium]